MDKLNELLTKRMETHHLGPEAIASQVCYSLNQIADGRYEAIRFKNGTLTVKVPSSSAASDLQAELESLKQRFNERVAPHVISRVIIRQ